MSTEDFIELEINNISSRATESKGECIMTNLASPGLL